MEPGSDFFITLCRWVDGMTRLHTQTGGSDRKRGQADGIKANRWMESVSGLAHQLKEWLLSRLGCHLGKVVSLGVSGRFTVQLVF